MTGIEWTEIHSDLHRGACAEVVIGWAVTLLLLIRIRLGFIGRTCIGLIVIAPHPTPRARVYFIPSRCDELYFSTHRHTARSA